jgi:hypothetical protein
MAAWPGRRPWFSPHVSGYDAHFRESKDFSETRGRQGQEAVIYFGLPISDFGLGGQGLLASAATF